MRLVSSTLLDLVIVLINRNTPQTRGLAKGIIGLFNSSSIREGTDQSLITFYTSLVNQIVAEEIDKSTPDLLLAVMIKFEGSDVFDEHPQMREQIKQLLSSTEVMPDKLIDRKVRMFRTTLEQASYQAHVRSLYRKIQEVDQIADEEEQLVRAEELSKMIREGLTKKTDHTGDEEFRPETYLSTDNHDSIRSQIDRYSERQNEDTIFITGLKGLNKIFGQIGGVPEGRTGCIISKANNYKSSLLRSLAFWMLAYNKPKPKTEEDQREDAVYFCSVENDTHDDLVWFYRKCYYHEYGSEPELRIKSDEWRKQATEYIMNFASSRGWTLIMERYLPSKLTADILIRRMDYLNKKYRLRLTVMDYLGKVSPPQGLQRDQQMEQLYTDVCSWTKTTGITFWTAHQTNTNFTTDTMAKSNKVKYGADRHIKDGPAVIREVDIVIFVLKEESNFGKEFLTLCKVKDRYNGDTTPLIDKYCAYEFVEPGIGGIPDDLNKETITYVRDINDVKDESFDASGTSAQAFAF